MKQLVLIICLIVSIKSIGQNKTEESSGSLNSIAVIHNSYLLDYSDEFFTGGTVLYTRELFAKGKHKFGIVPSFGFMYVENTETRYIFGLGAQYRFDATDRFSIGLALSGNYVLSVLQYDQFEYNAQGDFVNQGNKLHDFAPSLMAQITYDIIKKKSISIAPVFGFGLIRTDGGEYAHAFEDFNPVISNIGILVKF